MAAQLSLEQRVINVVMAWGDPVPFPVKKSSNIKDIWGDRADTFPFPDPATMTLIQKLQDEFKSGTDARVLTQLKPAVFDTGGAVTTLKDLITWIDDAPEPQHIVIAGFANESVKVEFASAVADALRNSPAAKTAPKTPKAKPKKRTGKKQP
jgi:hypothetical protein